MFGLGMLAARDSQASTTLKISGSAATEQQRKIELQNRLCRTAELDCKYVTSILDDPRLVIYQPPPTTPEQPQPKPPKERERNPYFTKRFNLLAPESLERCRKFVSEHEAAFDNAYKTYGVPKEIICGHLRLETDFGIPTKLSPHPFGTRPAVNQLVSLYVRNPSGKEEPVKFARRQQFAISELGKLLVAAKKNGWDLFAIPGSPTGAIGLLQFEPSSFSVAVDGDGDGTINLFTPDDAIVSLAHYLVTRGWDRNPEHQRRAVYAYYGGHYDKDPNKFYMKAVLKYADQVKAYLKEHPLISAST
jgi:membrane-bound lytic murein transglycosylase B